MIEINPMPESALLANIEIISATVEAIQEIAPNDGNKMVEYLAQITAVQSMCSETQASIKYYLLRLQGEVLDAMLRSQIEGHTTKSGEIVRLNIPPTTAKMFAHTRCKDYEYLYEKIERLSRNVSHTIDSVRTMISFAKSEFTNSQYQK